jgi:ankyrin repeat protein
MKAKFIKDFLFEFERSNDPDKIKDLMKIGNFKFRAENIIRKFSEENGYDFKINKNGNFEIKIKIPGTDTIKKFSVTFPEERKDTDEPISLRNESGQLMGRLSNSLEIIDRINKNIKREQKSSVRIQTPEENLLDAIKENNIEKVRELLKSGVTPNHSVRSKIDDNIPLIIAIQKENFDIIKDLIEAGADVNIKSSHDNTPIGMAISVSWSTNDENDNKKNFEIFKYLINKGGIISNISISNLEWRLGNTCFDIFKYLISSIGKDYFGKQKMINFLTSAVWMGEIKRVKFLLEMGIDPYSKSSYGMMNNSFETLLDALKGFGNNHPIVGENYHYSEVKKILEKYK